MRKPINQILPEVLREYVNVTALLDPNHDWFAEFGELMSLQSRSKFIMVRAIITKMNLVGIFKSYPSLLEVLLTIILYYKLKKLMLLFQKLVHY